MLWKQYLSQSMKTHHCPVHHHLHNSHLQHTFLRGLDRCPTSTADRGGNTVSYVVDTGVSLSTHTSPVNSNPLGQLISFQSRKWEAGLGTEQAGVMMMSHKEKKDRIVVGEAQKWVSRRRAELNARYMWGLHILNMVLLLIKFEVLPVMEI